MRTLPTQMIRVLLPFVPLFSKRVFGHAQVLLAGAILAPDARTVSPYERWAWTKRSVSIATTGS
jgi:hypothetical protein